MVQDTFVKIATESWQVLGQMSPYLLFGFLAAGMLSVCLSPSWVERHLGRAGFGPVLKASLFGVPLPLCSCGVIPVAASMRRHGASRAATTAFLLSTPQTGVDSVAVTYALLGPVFAVFRPLAALLTGLVGGGLVQALDTADGADESDTSTSGACNAACCADKHEHSILRRVLQYGFLTLPRDIGPALLVGIVVAGALAAFVPQNHLEAYIGGGVASILLLMAAGVPVYVCATASVPLAAGFMHLGASPGAALAFLIAGPATNAATFTTVWKVLGRRSAILYVLTVAGSAIAGGLLLNGLFPGTEVALPQLGSHAHGAAAGGWLYDASAVLLLAVLALSYWDPSAPGSHGEGTSEETAEGDLATHHDSLELVISGMTCGHCAESVRQALAQCAGVRSVAVDLKGGRAVVSGQSLQPDQLVAAVSEQGYGVESPL